MDEGSDNTKTRAHFQILILWNNSILRMEPLFPDFLGPGSSSDAANLKDNG